MIVLLVGNQKDYIVLFFLCNILLFCIAVNLGIKFDKDSLVVVKNIYPTKVVNGYIVYELDTCAKISLNNFKIKDCLFGVTNIVTNNHKAQWDNSSLSHSDNSKNNFLVLSEGSI